MRLVVRALVFLAVAAHALGPDADAVVAEGNPHTQQDTPTWCPAQALAPETFLPEALTVSRQLDTFVKAEQKTHMGAPVTVLHFKQPGRLSPLELPFSLVLLSDAVNPSGIVEVPAPRDEAQDSWFPDYAWERFVVCEGGGGAYRHLGWRFTRKASATGAGPASFIAMIVRSIDRQQRAAATAEPTPAVVIERVRVAEDGSSATEEEDNDQVDLQALEATLDVGIDAPTWLVGLTAAFTTRVSRSH